MSRESGAFDAFLDGFFDGFGMAGFFRKLRLPGAPTQVFADAPEKFQVEEPVEPAPVGIDEQEQATAKTKYRGSSLRSE